MPKLAVSKDAIIVSIAIIVIFNIIAVLITFAVSDGFVNNNSINSLGPHLTLAFAATSFASVERLLIVA